MEPYRHVPSPLYRRDGADVIDVGMRDPDGLGRLPGSFDFSDDRIRVATGVHDRQGITVRIGDEIAVLLKRADCDAGDDHAYPPLPRIAGSSVGDFIAVRYFSAATAAVVPSPAAVVTWRVS